MIQELEQLGIRAVFFSNRFIFVAGDAFRVMGIRPCNLEKEFADLPIDELTLTLPQDVIREQLGDTGVPLGTWGLTLVGLVYCASQRRLRDTYEVLHAIVFRKPGA